MKFTAPYVSASYLFIVFALPVLAVPMLGVEAGVQKGIFAAFFLGCGSVVGGAVIAVCRNSFSIPRSSFFLAPLALLATALVSSVFVPFSRMSLWGIGFEISTLGSIFLFAAIALTAAFVPPRFFQYFLNTFLISVSLAAVASLALHFWSPQLFRGETFAGEWPQLSFLIAGALLVAAIQIDKGAQRSFSLVCGSILTLCFILFFQSTAAALLAVCTVAAASYLFAYRASVKYFPLSSGFVVLMCIVLLVMGLRTPVLQLPSDARPSLLATEIIVAPLYLEHFSSALFGSGPGTLQITWDKYRTQQFNGGPLWDRPIYNSYSTASTIAITFGVVGLCALFFAPLSLAFGLRDMMAEDFKDVAPESVAFIALTLFLFASLIVYPVGLTVFLLAGASFGACTALFGRTGYSFVGARPMRIFVGVLSFVLGVLLLWVSGSQYAAAMYHSRGMAALETQRFKDATTLLASAAHTWPVNIYQRDSARADFESASKRLSEETNPSTHNLKEIQDQFENASNSALLATQSSPPDYSIWIFRASLSLALMNIGFPSAEGMTSASLSHAIALSPKRPDVPYLQAALDLKRGDISAARTHLEEALKLKPDYQDALDLLAHLNGGA